MVRVLTAHHFAGQDIQTCEDPIAVAAVPPDKLLLASSLHTIEVRDLSRGGEITSSFPTVDLVQHMLYSSVGDYVATLECSGQQGAVPRVYVHWTQGPGMQPMRARIAGRVTPSHNQGDASLEMIELPVRGGAAALACCQATGNVLVASRRALSIFRFSVRTLDSSRIRYIDFEDSQLNVSLSFVPSQVFLCEEMVVCMGRHSLLVLRLRHFSEMDAEEDQERSAGAGPRFNKDVDQSLDVTSIVQYEQEVNSGRRVSAVGIPRVPLPVTVQLPAIAAERASRGHCSPGSGVVHHNNPFVSDPSDVVASLPETSDYCVETLLRLQLAGDPQGGEGEQFGCLALQPLYLRGGADDTVGAGALCSRYRCQLSGVACLAATQQEGYLYHFPMDGSPPPAHPCVAVYPFTAPVIRVVLEPLGLHALTDTGLETYTLRSMHRSLQALQGVCPPQDDPICLIGLRPFLGARHLLAVGSHLVLLATSESPQAEYHNGDTWTLYSLRLPTPEVLFSDMVAVGESHRVASPTTYCHLLGEAHCVLAGARLISREPGMHLPEDAGALEALYCESCAHLADFYIASEDPVDRDLGARYYRMSHLSPTRVLERMRRHTEQERVRHSEEEQDAEAGQEELLQQKLFRAQAHYLQTEMLEAREEVRDDQLWRQLTGLLLDLLEAPPPGAGSSAHDLADLVLCARSLREYGAARTLHLLRKLSAGGGPPLDAEVCLALLVLEVQQGSDGQPGALEAVEALPAFALLDQLSRHSDLLLDSTRGAGPGLSEVAALLMEKRPAEMATLLASLVSVDSLSLAQILKIMLDFLSTKIGSSGSSGSVVSVVFQRFLETFFSSFFAAKSHDVPMDLATEEALKLLVRSYLSDLQATRSTGVTPVLPLLSVLLEADRLPFLDSMPPFAADLGERLASPVCHGAAPRSATFTRSGLDLKRLSLKKLQALLCSGRLPRSCSVEVLRFVRGQPQVVGNLSLQVLCSTVREAIALLLDFCPQAVLRYGQDMFRCEEDWRLLLAGLDGKVCAPRDQPSGQALYDLYRQTMSDVLDHLAHSVSVEELCRLLPGPRDNLRTHLHHLHTCQRVASANSVRNFITSTSAAFLTQMEH